MRLMDQKSSSAALTQELDKRKATGRGGERELQRRGTLLFCGQPNT